MLLPSFQASHTVEHGRGVNRMYKSRLSIRISSSSSRSISSPGRRCPDVSATLTDAGPPPLCLLLSSYQTYNVMYFSHRCLGLPLFLFPATIP